MPLGFKKASSSKKKTSDGPLSEKKSTDEVDTPPEVELAEALLKKELAEYKAKMAALKESHSGEKTDAMVKKISDLTAENADLKIWIKELRTENSDMKKVFGNLDDLGELRHQYEKLFEDDFQCSNSHIDLDDPNTSSASGPDMREKTREFCDDLKAFILDVKTHNLEGVTEASN